MPASEIDDIFALFKGKSRAPQPPQPSTSTAGLPKKKRSKMLKRKRDAGEADELDSKSKSPSKNRVPETVIDPSADHATSKSNHMQPSKAVQPTSPRAKKKKVDRKVEQRFRDSRGTGSSMCTCMLVSDILPSRSSQGARRRKDLRYIKKMSSVSQPVEVVSP